ncbi:hypothetical protein [Flavobacterium nackdongense]|uniref:Uncharacterized protein n=1 Tax=Flavobacterium nackdongense TaxID=2547394 RepID=A0A4V1AGR3_9FLAO|nr:hypothetical protein [Flavobacterium nackdongense]QBN18942.1 hypothetical protein E1750_09035 [Flavobacterium nackdongense]
MSKAIIFEQTIQKYWGNPTSGFNFANYYGDNFKMHSLIFSIVVYEINYKKHEYNEEDFMILEEYENKCWKTEGKESTTFDDSIKILEFLNKRK